MRLIWVPGIFLKINHHHDPSTHPSTIIHPSIPHSRDLVSETGKVSQVLPMALGSPVVMLSALCCRKPGGGAV